jgi:hypothetical protein
MNTVRITGTAILTVLLHGYYLYNSRYPNVAIAISISM